MEIEHDQPLLTSKREEDLDDDHPQGGFRHNDGSLTFKQRSINLKTSKLNSQNDLASIQRRKSHTSSKKPSKNLFSRKERISHHSRTPMSKKTSQRQQTFDRLWIKSVERERRKKEKSELFKKSQFTFHPNSDFKMKPRKNDTEINLFFKRLSAPAVKSYQKKQKYVPKWEQENRKMKQEALDNYRKKHFNPLSQRRRTLNSLERATSKQLRNYVNNRPHMFNLRKETDPKVDFEQFEEITELGLKEHSDIARSRPSKLQYSLTHQSEFSQKNASHIVENMNKALSNVKKYEKSANIPESSPPSNGGYNIYKYSDLLSFQNSKPIRSNINLYQTKAGTQSSQYFRKLQDKYYGEPEKRFLMTGRYKRMFASGYDI